jgi:hypothetical protein
MLENTEEASQNGQSREGKSNKTMFNIIILHPTFRLSRLFSNLYETLDILYIMDVFQMYGKRECNKKKIVMVKQMNKAIYISLAS